MEAKTPVPTNKTGFLSTKRNKQNLIMMLSEYLACVEVTHAGEGDVEASELAETASCVNVIAEDTDGLILLLYHSCFSSNIFMEAKQHTFSIKTAKKVLSRELCLCLSTFRTCNVRMRHNILLCLAWES